MRDLSDRQFRARLQRELAAWRAEGLVTEEVAQRLAARYQLDEAHEGRGLATAAVYVIGVLLIGGGVISLVAWNWEALPASAKLLLIGSAMVAAHFYGYRWWKVDASRPRLGHALTVLGTLIFGADIGLVAQVFHISGHWYNGFLAWGAGALVAAWAYASVPQGVVAIAMTFVGWAGLVGRLDEVAAPTSWLFLLIFLPLAWRHSSRVLFALTALAFGAALPVAAAHAFESGLAVSVAVAGTGAALLGWGFLFGPDTRGAWFADTARIIGLALVVGLAYVTSFADVAGELPGDRGRHDFATWLTVGPPLLVGLIALARLPGGSTWHRGAPVTAIALAATLVLTGALFAGDLSLVVAANATLVVVAAAAISTAVERLDRTPFWLGSVLAGAVVVTRFLEFDTDLWLKALGFIAAGVALIAFGVAFERRVDRRPSGVA